MKSFLEEYGFAILAAIVVILLIAMCTPVGNLIKNQILGVVDSFAGKTEAKLAAVDAALPMEVALKEDKDGNGYIVTATTDSASDVINVEFRIKDQNGNWSNWKSFGDALPDDDKAHEATYVAAIKNGESIQVRCYDLGKDGATAKTFYESNIVEHTRPEVQSGTGVVDRAA